MKRKILFSALSLGLAGSACAQSSSSVILYGIADGDLRIDHTAVGTLKSVGAGGEAGTRWGIRGTEDLGNGFRALFIFEQGFDLSDNSVAQGNVTPVTPNSPVSSSGGRLFSRVATVGLSSDSYGEVRLGRGNTPFYNAWSSTDPMAGGLVGNAQNFALGNAVRFDNAIYYDTPKFYGFQATSAYRLGESDTDSVASGSIKNGAGAWSASLIYTGGPLFVTYSFMGTKNALNTNDVRTQVLGAIYDFGVFKIHGLAFDYRDDTNIKQRAFGLGTTVPYGSWNLFLQVARIDNRYDTNGSNLKENDSLFYGAAVQYNFSRRTDLYLSAAKRINNGGAQYLINDASNAGLMTTANVPAGFDPWSAQVGIRHKF